MHFKWKKYPNKYLLFLLLFFLFIICLVVCALSQKQNVCRQIENVKKYCIFQFLSITTINVETRYNVVVDQQRVTLVILLSSGVTIILRLTDKRHYNGGHNHSISHTLLAHSNTDQPCLITIHTQQGLEILKIEFKITDFDH